MNCVNFHRQFKSIAKQAGFMSTSWLAIGSLSTDRTPEGYNNISRVLREGQNS